MYVLCVWLDLFKDKNKYKDKTKSLLLLLPYSHICLMMLCVQKTLSFSRSKKKRSKVGSYYVYFKQYRKAGKTFSEKSESNKKIQSKMENK